MLSHQWEYLYMSLCGSFPIGEYIFTVPDAYSRYPETVFLKDTSSKSLIKELVDIFQTLWHWKPMTLKTDNGPNLVSVEMKNYLCSKGIHHAKLATYWPRSNGEVKHYKERLLKSICAIHVDIKDWWSYFNSMLLNYCSNKHAATQAAPAMLLFIRDKF